MSSKLFLEWPWGIILQIIFTRATSFFSLLGVLCCCVAYNVGLPEARIFSGPSDAQFGYSVQQLINPKGNW